MIEVALEVMASRTVEVPDRQVCTKAEKNEWRNDGDEGSKWEQDALLTRLGLCYGSALSSIAITTVR